CQSIGVQTLHTHTHTHTGIQCLPAAAATASGKLSVFPINIPYSHCPFCSLSFFLFLSSLSLPFPPLPLLFSAAAERIIVDRLPCQARAEEAPQSFSLQPQFSSPCFLSFLLANLFPSFQNVLVSRSFNRWFFRVFF